MPRPHRYAKPSTPSSSAQRSIYRTSNQHDSPLFKLPLEIREQIWYLALPRTLFNTTCVRVKPSCSRCKSEAVSSSPHTSPLPHLWSQDGNISLLRTCKRVHAEAGHVFFHNNLFDIVIDSVEPSISMHRGPLLPYTDRWPYRSRPGGMLLRNLRREHIASLRYICITVPTHLGLDWEAQQDAFEDDLHAAWPSLQPRDPPWNAFQTSRVPGHMRGIVARWAATRREGMTYDMRRYRLQVLQGVDRWSQLACGGREKERRFAKVEVRFCGYPGAEDGEEGFVPPDEKLVEDVLAAFPRWLVEQMVNVSGVDWPLWGNDQVPITEVHCTEVHAASSEQGSPDEILDS